MVDHVTSETFDAQVLGAPGRVLVDFFATWCGPCNTMSAVLDEIVQNLPEDRVVYKLDVDENQDLGRTYKVMGVPTLVLFENGKEIDRAAGVQSKHRIEEMLA